MKRMWVPAVLSVGAAVLLTGCMPKMTVEDMRKMMPTRPAELDRLNGFVGTWKFDGHMSGPMLAEPITTSGTTTIEWDESRWFIVNRGDFQMEGLDPMHALETMGYDTNAKVYRSTWTDSMGGFGMGETRYDATGNVWRMSATSYGPHGKMSMKGTMKFVDDNTMEWQMEEYSGLMKTMEWSGLSKRQM